MSNEFKLFAGPSTNTLTPAAWAALTSLLTNGFSPGIASSQQANTLFRQLSTVAAGVGQFISNAGGNALDNGDINAFATALMNAIWPSGIITDFGGETPPTGWLECDGSSLLRASYPALFSAIGTLHGAADSTHFNIPDHRGRYKSGWAHTTGTSVDGNSTSRTAAAAGGATGNHVGTLQGDAIRNITGVLDFVGGGGLSGSGAFSTPHAYYNQITAGVIASQPGGANFDASLVVPTGANTRPNNAAVMSIIKI